MTDEVTELILESTSGTWLTWLYYILRLYTKILLKALYNRLT